MDIIHSKNSSRSLLTKSFNHHYTYLINKFVNTSNTHAYDDIIYLLRDFGFGFVFCFFLSKVKQILKSTSVFIARFPCIIMFI